MKQAEIIYSDLWRKTLPLFQKDQFEIDPLATDLNDMRRGLTLRARPSKEVVREIEKFTRELERLAPNQYFTPVTDLHLTVLAIVSCHDGFHHDAALDKSYIETISECIRELPLPRIRFHGITASPSCLLLRGYSENNGLAELRSRLRDQFKESTLPNSIDARYSIKTAHSTIMRFQSPQRSLCDFTQFITKNKNYDFGTQELNEIELVSNDWCHKEGNTDIVRVFPLKSENSFSR